MRKGFISITSAKIFIEGSEGVIYNLQSNVV